MKKNLIFIASIVCVFAILLVIKLSIDSEDEKKNDDIYEQATAKNVEVKGYKGEVYNDVTYGKEEKFYGFQEVVEFNSFSIKIESAELKEKLNAEDENNETLISAIESDAVKDIALVFEEELRYLYITYEMTNLSDENQNYEFAYMQINSRREDNALGAGATIRLVQILDTGKENQLTTDSFGNDILCFNPHETINFQMIATVIPAEVYDLYLATSNRGGKYDENYLSLDIRLYETDGFMFIDDEISDNQKRNLKELKINKKYTNYSFFDEQEEGFQCLDQYLYGLTDTVGFPLEHIKGEVEPGIEMQVLDVNLYEEINQLSEDFQKDTYLERMTALYCEELTCEEEAIRYLYVKVKMTQLGNTYEKISTYIPQQLWIYNRDDNGSLWRLGYPDDYRIISSTNKEQLLGGYHLVYTEPKEELVVEAVYVIPPNMLYNVYLFTCNGVISDDLFGSDNNKMNNGGISLDINNQEQGGIK